MKSQSNPFLRRSLAALLTLAAPPAFADTVSSSADVRVISFDPNGNDPGALSLYNESSGTNTQRTFLNFNLSSYSGNSITTDATMTLTAGIFGNFLTGVSLGTANSAWTQAGITWSNQPGLTPIAGATNPNGTFGSGPVTWTIPWYMVEKMATTGSGYNHGLGITSGVGSTQHFQSTGSGGPAPTLSFSAAAGASGTWTGGDGNWTDPANWAGGTVAEGIGQAATIDGGTAVNITMDANRSVGSLSFSGGDHTLSSGKLALNGTSGSPTISVEAARTATIGATVVGIDGLTKSGDGHLTLTGANTYTGNTTISAGTLQIGNGGSTGSLASGTVLNNANLVYSRDASSTVSLLSGGNISGSGTLSATAGVIQFNGNLTQGGNLSFTQTGTAAGYKGLELVAASTTLTASSITLSGDVGKRNSDGNSLALDTSAANGTINLDISLGREGIWYIPSGFSANAGTGTINITGSGQNDTGWRDTPVTLSGAVNMTAGVNSAAAVTINSNGTSGGVVSGAFSGGMSLTKTGSGTLTLTGKNTHTGTTNVNEGMLELKNNDWIFENVAGAGVTVGSGATLRANNSLANRLNGLTLNGGTVDAIGGGNADWGNFFLTGNVTASGNSNLSADIALRSTNVDFDVASGGTLNVGGKLHNGVNFGADLGGNGGNSGGTASTVTKSGAGTMILTGPNIYTGATTIRAGTLQLGNGTNNAGLADSADVTVDSGATLELNYLAGNTDSIDELTLGGVSMPSGTYGAGTYSGATITGTGFLFVQNGPPADPFANWMATNYPGIVSPDNEPGADPDKDGIANLVEYVLQGGDPSVSTAGILPTLDASGANFIFTYFRRTAATGTTQTFEYSTTLGAGSWTPVAIPGGSGVVVSPNTPSAGIDQVQVIVAKGANTKLFGRLQVVK